MSARTVSGLPLWQAAAIAAVGGVLDALAFPGLGWWPLVFLGTPLVLLATVGRRVGGSILVGLVAGFAFWGTHIFWLTVYLGAVPWLALAGLQTIFSAAGLALISLAWRFGDRIGTTGPVATGAVPLVVAGLWTLREFVAGTWPYGGFSWGRLAFSQSESPFNHLVAWVGVSGLSFLIAWVSALVVVAARRPTGVRRILRSIPPVALLIVMLLVPAFPVQQSGTARIAAVQGDADAGLFARYTPGQILEDHLDATEPLYGKDVDLLVWPENASDIDPLRNDGSATTLDYVTDRVGAPLITGTITTADDGGLFNSLLLWENGQGAVAQYDKIHPVPFAEYLPDRAFWYPLAPGLFDLVPQDFGIGQRPNVFDIDVGGSVGQLKAGLAICFDIVDDALVQKMIDDGAEVIIAPTNNADFGRTDESVQQLAIARLRAIETGRSLVNASTVGTSAIITPDGGTLDRLTTFEPGTMLRDVPLSTTTTPATNIGRGIETTVSAIGLGGLLLLVVAARRRVPRGSRRARGSRRRLDHENRTPADG